MALCFYILANVTGQRRVTITIFFKKQKKKKQHHYLIQVLSSSDSQLCLLTNHKISKIKNTFTVTRSSLGQSQGVSAHCATLDPLQTVWNKNDFPAFFKISIVYYQTMTVILLQETRNIKLVHPSLPSTIIILRVIYGIC